jgi:capsular polysaccharide transport system permease protein
MADEPSDQERPVSKVRWLKTKAAAKPRAEPLKLGPAPPPDDQGPPEVKKPEIPQFLVGPPAQPARTRRRHWLLVLSFAVLVVLPSMVTAFYLWQRAADQYASDVAFSVRTEEKSSAIELLGGITELSGSSSSDTDILFAYLSSQELVSRVNDRVDLRAIWSRVSPVNDPVLPLIQRARLRICRPIGIAKSLSCMTVAQV